VKTVYRGEYLDQMANAQCKSEDIYINKLNSVRIVEIIRLWCSWSAAWMVEEEILADICWWGNLLESQALADNEVHGRMNWSWSLVKWFMIMGTELGINVVESLGCTTGGLVNCRSQTLIKIW